jgi:hypothetical protein
MSEQAMEASGARYLRYSTPLDSYVAHLKTLSRHLYSTAARATRSGAQQAQIVKGRLDPVISKLGEAARVTADLLAIPAALTGSRRLGKAYVGTSNLGKSVSDYETKGSAALDEKIRSTTTTADYYSDKAKGRATELGKRRSPQPTTTSKKKKKKKKSKKRPYGVRTPNVRK